jgi:long-chain fatty acid transport protein
MNASLRVVAVVMLSVALAPVTGHAAGTTLPYEYARELALSDAAVANQTGPQAIFLNPAALASQHGFAISGAAEWLYNRTDWSDPTLGSASTVPKLNVPVAGALSYSGKVGSVGFGVGAGVEITNGASLVWPNYWPGAQEVQTVKQQIYGMELGVALKPVPWFSIGATFYYYRSVEDLTQRIGFITQTGEAVAGLAGGQPSWGISGQFDVPKIPLSIAINYRHKANITLEGNVHFNGVPPTFADVLQDQSLTHRFTVPNVMTAGLSYRFPLQIALMAAYTLERWIEYRDDEFVGGSGFTVTVPRNHRNGHVFRLAAEWLSVAGTGLIVRLGGLRSISPQPTETISPTLTDSDSWAVSGGIGYKFADGLTIDLGYQHAFFQTVTATGEEAFPGTYKTDVDLLSLGATVRIR